MTACECRVHVSARECVFGSECVGVHVSVSVHMSVSVFGVSVHVSVCVSVSAQMCILEPSGYVGTATAFPARPLRASGETKAFASAEETLPLARCEGASGHGGPRGRG